MPKFIFTTDRTTVADALKSKTTQTGLAQMRTAAPLSINEKERAISYVLSDETVDRMGDVIRQEGWDLGEFRANPVMPWGHNYDEPPIGAWRDVFVRGPQLVGTAIFAKAEDYSFADTIFRLSARGFLKGVSVGFLPLEWQPIPSESKGLSGYEFLKLKLWECSACTVPANPNALARAAKDGAISKRELAEVVTRRVLADLGELSPADLASGKAELFSRLQKMETEIETLKAIITESSDAGGQPAASQAPASAEAAKILDLIAELKKINTRKNDS